MELYLGFLWVIQSIYPIYRCFLGSAILSEFFLTEKRGFGVQYATVVFLNPSS